MNGNKYVLVDSSIMKKKNDVLLSFGASRE